MAQRLKGQEVTLSFTGPGGGEDGLEVVKSFEAELDLEILTERYLGETNDRYDDIFNGVSGRAELHIESSAYFKFTQRVQDRAQRRSPAAGKFSAVASFAFPNGQRARLSFEDIFFGTLPIRVPGRAEYVTVSVAWKCSNMRRVI